SAQEQFTATLSAVEDAVHFAFRTRLRPQEYEEALAEAMAAAWSAWHGLVVKRGKDPVAVGVHGIATNAIRNVRQGRRVGNPSGGSGRSGPSGNTVARSSGGRRTRGDAGSAPPPSDLRPCRTRRCRSPEAGRGVGAGDVLPVADDAGDVPAEGSRPELDRRGDA